MGTIYRNGTAFVGSGGAGGVEMTQAEYDLLPTSEKMNGAIYFITDGEVSYPSASQMRYDNTESQIPSTTVQGAIDENRIEINDLKSGEGVSVSVVDTSHFSLTNANVYRFGKLVVGSVILQCTSDFSNGEMIQFNGITLSNYSFNIGAVSASQWAYDITKSVRLYFKTNGTVVLTSTVTNGQYLTIPVCFKCS